MKQFGKLADVRIAALCDPDQKLLDEAGERHSGAKKYTDLRKLLDDSDVDAVVIATCNHWHALAAIWACEAGKDVYVEKPLAHNHWEGQQVVHAARKYDRIVQVGTQQRSDPLQAELKKFPARGKSARQHRVRRASAVSGGASRSASGRRRSSRPKSLDYNLWLGPARDEPIYRDKLHYDWHWDWNTGNGEMGNWGVHVIDDAVNVVLRDRVPFPKRLLAAGGRVAWNDAGETPNVCFAYYDTGSIPVLFGLTNLPNEKGSKEDVKYWASAAATSSTAKAVTTRAAAAAARRTIATARSSAGSRAIPAQAMRETLSTRSTRTIASRLNAEVEIGHQSTAWCNLVNVACRIGAAYADEKTRLIGTDVDLWQQLVGHAHEHLQRNGVDIAKSEFKISPVLEFDDEREQFIGDAADAANQLLRREYRGKFAVPSIA